MNVRIKSGASMKNKIARNYLDVEKD